MQKIYLRLFFQIYPDKKISEIELYEALRPIPVTYEDFTKMTSNGITDGWLDRETLEDIDYYSKI